MKNLIRATCLGLLLSAFASAGQQKVTYGSPLTVDVVIADAGVNTKFTVTFRNRGDRPVENLKVQRVGLPIFAKDFCPAYQVPTIKQGKTYTLNVFLRGHIVVTSRDEIVQVIGTYRAGRDSFVMDKRIYINCD